MSFGLICTVLVPTHAIKFESDQLTVNDRTGKATLSGNVTVWNDTATIKANRIIVRYATDGDTVNSYEAFGNVRINHARFKADSNYAYRDVRADTLLLQEDAHVERKQDEYWADRITVNVRTSQVKLSGSVRGHLKQRGESREGKG